MPNEAHKLAAHPGELLDTAQAADFLNLSVPTLETWRCRKEGPPFVRLGRAVRYQPDVLRAWLDRHTVQPEVA